jgi:enhancing lycopene biosynthesis protein 2
VAAAITTARAADRPIGALCIAPAVLAKVLGAGKLTIGSDPGTAAGLEAMGATHQVATHGEIVVDDTLRLVTSPCYMLDATISQIADGAANTVAALMAMVGDGA